MQVDDPRLYEMITTKEDIFAWEIKSRANVIRCILFGCVQTELKRRRHAHVPPRSHEGVLTPHLQSEYFRFFAKCESIENLLIKTIATTTMYFRLTEPFNQIVRYIHLLGI